MEEIDRNKDKSCNEKNKRIFKIIFCPCYCFCYKTFKCFCDERFGFEPYYETFLFIENILFCLISIIDLQKKFMYFFFISQNNFRFYRNSRFMVKYCIME